MPEMTEDQLVELGFAAGRLLEDAAFVHVMNTVSDRHVLQMIGSKPHEQKTREHHYNQILALREFADALREYAATADEIVRRREQDEEE